MSDQDSDPAVSPESNQALAIEFLEATFNREPERMQACLADGAEYRVMGKGPRFQRVWNRDTWAEYLALPNPFADGYSLTIHSVTAEEERVVVEAEGHGVVAATGAVYNNRYAFIFVVGGGKILRIREYMDTEHVTSVFPAQVKTP